jgi:hypothetical protein
MWISEIDGGVLNMFPTKEECEAEAKSLTKLLDLKEPKVNIYFDTFGK